VIAPENGRPYARPLWAGLVLGVIVAVAFLAGHYFGASRVFATLARRLRGDTVSLDHWMTWELVGLFAGALGGALVTRRFGWRWTRGPRVSPPTRFVAAALGGALVMVATRFAAGCTSGLAVSGGIRLSVGAYVFMALMFAGGFAAAALGRKLWT